MEERIANNMNIEGTSSPISLDEEYDTQEDNHLSKNTQLYFYKLYVSSSMQYPF